jgi:hypothetical protein
VGENIQGKPYRFSDAFFFTIVNNKKDPQINITALFFQIIFAHLVITFYFIPHISRLSANSLSDEGSIAGMNQNAEIF